MTERQEEGASVHLAPSPKSDLPTQKEDTGANGQRKALAVRLGRMAEEAKQTYIESAASIGLNNSAQECDLLGRLRRQWKMVEEAAELAQEEL